MTETYKIIPLEERFAKNPASYIEVNGKPTNPDAWPLQVRNGVISVDFGAGCLGCTWCITKRQPGRTVIQNTPYVNRLSAGELHSLLLETRAFTEAKLPLRIGNNTDGTLIPVEQLKTLYDSLPKDYPVALLTRGIHSSQLTDFLATTNDNFVLCRTITPPHSSLDYKISLDKALKSFNDADCQKVLNIGPLAKDTMDDTLQLLRSGKITPGTRVIIAPLNRRLIMNDALANVSAKPITREQMRMLEICARENGMIVHRANNCVIADFTRNPSVEYGDINEAVLYNGTYGSKTAGTSNNRGLDPICIGCRNHDTCSDFFDSRQVSIDELKPLLTSLGIKKALIKHQAPGLIVIDAPGITKAETSYLSGMLGIRLTGIHSLAQPDEEAAKRWIATGFYPVEKMAILSDALDPLRLQHT